MSGGRAESLRTASGGSTASGAGGHPRPPEREASVLSSTLSTRAPIVEVSLKLGQLEADAAAAAAAHGGGGVGGGGSLSSR